MEWLAWFWAALALVLLVAEIFVAGFVLACFAAGAGAAALVALLGFDLMWQVVAFAVVTLLAVLFIRPVAGRLTKSAGQNTVGIDRVLGKRAVVLVAIDPISARGRVRIEREEWQAVSDDGSLIPANSVVEVLGVEGTRVRVRALPLEADVAVGGVG